MDINFTKCLAFVLKEEGGNDNDPDDPGGRTSRGVTQTEYNAYCKVAGLPQGDVWQAPEIVITNIYNKSYWHPYCPTLPAGIDLVFFDETVNAGPHEAILCLQRALGVTADGHLGLVTSHALIEIDHKKAVDNFTQQRIRVYRETKRFRKYGKGWIARANVAHAAALELMK